ncbi:MAG: HD-GYP domain-containing protein, partial [Candidatus Hinthialibacter sp.]
HLHRVREYCSLLASILAQRSKFQTLITPVFIENIYIVSPLHDIGKVAIPDGILLKPGKLTRDEFEIIKQHSIIGGESIARVLEYCDNETFRMAYNIVRHHHERYDGNGYPDGLKGEEIPLEARIVTIADYYDAILSKRSYKQPFTYDQAAEEIRNQSGIFFDPDIADVMLAHLDQFESIHQKYM